VFAAARLALLVLAAALLATAATALAQPAARPAPEMVVGVYADPPFTMKNARGDWEGLAVSLWREVARREGIEFRFEEQQLEPLLEALAAGRVDAVIGPLLITPHRAERFDMTSSFMHVSLAIATRPASWTSLLGVLTGLLNRHVVTTVLGLGLALVGVAIVVWWLERHRNPDHFGGEGVKGIGDAVWWSASTMTTVGYGDRTPITLWGRVVGVIWMFVSIVLVSTFIATVSSTLTIGQLRSEIRSIRDLPGLRVGVVEGSGAAEYLDGLEIGAQRYLEVTEGVRDLARGDLDAFVDEWPVLRYLGREDFAGRIAVVAQPFTQGYVGFALPLNSPRRRAIDVTLLDVLDDPAWQEVVKQYLDGD
jgi:ABC-type amino acid transport substrate-binding protein